MKLPDVDGMLEELEHGGHEEGALARRLAAAEELNDLPYQPSPASPPDVAAWVAEKKAAYRAFGDRLRGEIPPLPTKNAPGPMRAHDQLAREKRILATFKAEHAALTFWLESMQFPPPEIGFRAQRAYDGVKGARVQCERNIEQRESIVAQLAARVEELEGPKRRGREMALANAEAGVRKVMAAIDEEQLRHADAIQGIDLATAMARTPAAQRALLDRLDAEERLHAKVLERLDVKADTCAAALVAARASLGINAVSS